MSPARHDRGSESLVSLDHPVGQYMAALLLLVWALLGLANLAVGVSEGSVLSLTLGVLALGTGGFGFWCLIRSMGGEQR